MTHRIFPIASLVLLVSSLPVLSAPSQRVFNFNPGWKLLTGDPQGAEAASFDDSGWKPVTLPHAWNEDSAFRVSIDQHPTGIAWYRKTFKLPAASEGKKVFLEFEGIRQGGEFYLNGRHIGRHENGVTAFGFDVTAFVNPPPAENLLAVRTDNAWDYREKASKSRYQWSDRNFNANYGGIPKNVKLHITDKLYQTLPLHSNLGTTGVYVHAAMFDLKAGGARITAESEVRNEHPEARPVSLEVVLEELDGREVARFSSQPATIRSGGTVVLKASASASGLKFWSWGYGYLYKVRTRLMSGGNAVDEVVTTTGFRKAEFGHGMVRLNERIIQMHGYAQRTSNEWPASGNAVPPWLSDFSNGLMVESNGNLVRWMHTCPSKQDVESCDRVGLIQAMPAGDAERDVTGRRWEHRVEAMRDAIIYNRNNPSILFYEGGNAGISEEHMAELKALRDRFDPHGGRAIGSREMLGSKVAEYGGEMLYINKSARLPFWSTEYSRDEGLRKYWDEFSPPFHKDGDGPPHKGEPAPTYNRNQDSHAVENVVRWHDYWRERPGTGTRVSSGGVNIVFSDSNTHYRGAENYRRSGEVDAMRIPKDGFFAHQVMWDGWVDVENPRAHIIGHWNYAAEVTKDVQVVSSADEVELLLNGRSLGKGKQSHRFLFTFEKVRWQPGVLTAIGRDRNQREVCRAQKETAGEPVALRLTPMTAPGGLKADGADMALIEIEVVDENGRRCPTALNLVDFNLSGPAEWRGGIAQGPDNHILSKSLPVECGVNRVLVRSLPESGAVTLRAKSAGLKSAEVTFDTKPFAATGGLAAEMPDSGLKPSLKRGPTPATPSFKVTRITVPVVRATAGANADKVSAAFDDNEETTWSNDNRLGSAWISCELAREAAVSEVSLKLSGWRQRRYPIRITLDGKEVYRDVTPLSLGYVTLPLKPARGKTLRIELLRPAITGDGFDIKELANPNNASTGDKGMGKGSLGIVEIDCFEAATNK